MMAVEDHGIEYGKIFGSWQIRELIGTGSKGRTKVYRITKDAQGGMEAGEERALKAVTICEDARLENMTANARAEYSANQEMLIEKARNEVHLMKRLEGAAHIVGYLDWEIRDRTGGTDLLIAMHLLETLETLQKTRDVFCEEEVLQVGIDICKALVQCQEGDIIHRDIKPANIFRRPDGRGGYMLGDFGISRIVDNGMGASTEIGTPAYAAPEQVRRGSYDSRVDIYSLGMVLYEMSNRNRLPFAGSRYSTREIIERRVILGEEIPTPSDVSPALASVILKACAFHPEDRFQSAEEFLNALEGIRNGRITGLSVSDIKSGLELDPYATMPMASFVQEDLPTAAQKLALIREKIAPARWRIAGGRYQTLAILPRGKIWTKGGQGIGGCDHRWNSPKWSSWRDVRSIINIFERVIGITSYGSVILANDSSAAGSMAEKWNSISMIACSRREYAGLRYDGTVVSTAEHTHGRTAQWQGIKEIAFFDGKLFGLCSDGTIKATRYKQDKDKNLTRHWCDIVSIASYPTHDGRLVGLRSDGTVIAVGDNDIGKCDFSAWKDIVAVACGPHHTLGLRADGTVVATGKNNLGECDVGEWKHIIAIACGSNHSVGLCDDGTLVAAGDNRCYQCDVIKVRLKKG